VLRIAPQVAPKGPGAGRLPAPLSWNVFLFIHFILSHPSVAAPQPGEQLHSAQLRVAAYRAILDRLSITFGSDHPTVLGIAKSIATAEAERDFWQLQVDALQSGVSSN
jgi:hypothetical protein